MKRMHASLMLSVALALPWSWAQCAAVDYPSRPIRIIVPFPPGGSNDLLARYFGDKLTERLGQQTVIDNRAGANGIIGTQLAAGTTPDAVDYLFADIRSSQILGLVWSDADDDGEVDFGAKNLSKAPGKPIEGAIISSPCLRRESKPYCESPTRSRALAICRNFCDCLRRRCGRPSTLIM